MRTLKILVVLLLCLPFSAARAQTRLLDRKVSLQYREATLATVLADLQTNYGLHFSYSSDRIPLRQRVSIGVRRQPLSEVLDALFANLDVAYQVVGSQIVLKSQAKNSAPPLNSPAPRAPEALIRQEPLDVAPVATESRVVSAPSIDSSHRASRSEQAALRRRQRWQRRAELAGGLVTTTIQKGYQLAARTSDKLFPSRPDTVIADTLSSQPDTSASLSEEGYQQRTAQLTFVPPLSTNGRRAGRTVNRFSVNVLAGRAAGLKGVELAGLVNVERDTVRGFQAAGFANVVGKEVTGLQMAGFCNVNGGYTSAVQLAGFINIVGSGVQGGQVAGFLNIARGSVYGLQVAGFANIAGNNVDGGQVAGFLNLARGTVTGSQLGFINVADSVTGVSIGFLSFVRKGYRRLEVFSTETMYANLTFKTGNRIFHNILALSAHPVNDQVRWGFGYGFGSELRLSNRLAINLDLVAYQISETNPNNENRFRFDRLNLLNQAKAALSVGLSKRVYLFAGPTFNVLVSDKDLTSAQTYGFDGRYSYNELHGDVRVRMWTGVQAGIRF